MLPAKRPKLAHNKIKIGTKVVINRKHIPYYGLSLIEQHDYFIVENIWEEEKTATITLPDMSFNMMVPFDKLYAPQV